MNQLTQHQVFNNPQVLIEGWYWAFRSSELKRKKTRAHNFLGKELVFYRGEDGRVVAMDAYCPHMGAHLAEGRVEGNELRCLFHYWKFSANGACTEIPCQPQHDFVPKVKTYPVEEKYGMVWLWTGETPKHPVPYVPELKDDPCDAILGNQFEKNCHPSVVMINAIDAQHFNSVHNIPVELYLKPERVNENCINFNNQTKIPTSNPLLRFAGRFYKGPLTYNMSYWYGATGSVTVGPDFLHFHIIFALRPTLDGRTEGQTILVTKRRSGVFGKLFNRVVLFLTKVVGNYFAKGDTLIFQTIKFNFQTPIKADQAIISFIQHAEKQRLATWGDVTHGGRHGAMVEDGSNRAAHTRRPISHVRDPEQIL
ncbi:MAG TPA: aromatic ring-hydroxylating dioxygenase subunit alpha [Bdellovibrionales bacterium]|nr:aromatic ring-hydroxylating dioxygenase subunit alpha [Bdellovibrionales bacterium]